MNIFEIISLKTIQKEKFFVPFIPKIYFSKYEKMIFYYAKCAGAKNKIDYRDLLSYAFEGFEKAREKWKPVKKLKDPSPYLRIKIRGSIQDGIRKDYFRHENKEILSGEPQLTRSLKNANDNYSKTTF